MPKWIPAMLLSIFSCAVAAQNIAINESGAAPHSSAMLDISSPDKGFLVPRLTTHTAIASPAIGLLVFNTTTNTFWYYNGTQWTEITFPVSEIRDTDGDTWISVENTPDEDIIRFGAASDTSQLHFDGKTLHWTNSSIYMGDQSGTLNSGNHNTYLGFRAGPNVTSGSRSTIIGSQAAQNGVSLFDQLIIGYLAGSSLNNPSDANVMIGIRAGRSSVVGRKNTFIGYEAGMNSTGNENTFIGHEAGERVTTGIHNTYVGLLAGARNHTGQENVAIGYGAHGEVEYDYTVPTKNNVFIGWYAGRYSNGNSNVMIGHTAGERNQNGWNNTFVGYRSGSGNSATSLTEIDGINNAFFGWQAGMNCTSGSNNVFFGSKAGQTVTTGEQNVFIGYEAGYSLPVTTSNTLAIANGLTNSKILIYGRFEDYGVGGKRVGINTTLPSHTFTVNGDAAKPGGGEWATYSDQRVKSDIKPFEDGLDVVLQLEPVSFRYNDKAGVSDTETEFIGFVAQDVENVAPYMVSQYDDSDGPSGLSDKRVFDGSALTQILVNAIQEQQAQISNLEDRIARLEKLLLQENSATSEVKH